jgi:hypothetical protein
MALAQMVEAEWEAEPDAVLGSGERNPRWNYRLHEFRSGDYPTPTVN